MINKSVITHCLPKSPVSEAYRVLRTNIRFSSVDKPIKVILVTSAGPSEGKSTTITNIAVTFAQSGSKVLLIDADLRKPKLHKFFYEINNTGLTNLLTGNGEGTTQIYQSGIENLDVIFSGPIPPNPSEILGSNSMKRFLEQMREAYDVILIDSPPVGTVTDAQILSTISDGVILVAASGQVTIESLQRAKELLVNVKANILGVVLNKLEKSSNSNYYYYYYYYYDDEGNKKKERRRHRNSEAPMTMPTDGTRLVES